MNSWFDDEVSVLLCVLDSLLEQVFFLLLKKGNKDFCLPWFGMKHSHKKQIYELKHRAGGFFSIHASVCVYSSVKIQRLLLWFVLGTGFSLSARLQI